MPKNLKILKYVAFIMLTSSVFLIVLGVYFYTEKEKELKTYILIKCKITQIDEPVRGDAVLTMRDMNGTYPPFKYNVHYDASESSLEYEASEIYEVYYNPKDVSKSEIKDFFNNYETGFIMLIIGFVFLMDFPIMLFVINQRKKRTVKSSVSYNDLKDSVISE